MLFLIMYALVGLLFIYSMFKEVHLLKFLLFIEAVVMLACLVVFMSTSLGFWSIIFILTLSACVSAYCITFFTVFTRVSGVDTISSVM